MFCNHGEMRKQNTISKKTLMTVHCREPAVYPSELPAGLELQLCR